MPKANDLQAHLNAPSPPNSISRSLWRDLSQINAISLLCQIIQVGSFPVLIPLLLSQQAVASIWVGLIAALPWAVVLFASPWVAKRLRQHGERRTTLMGVALSLLSILLLWLAGTALAWVGVASFLMGLGLTLRWVACDTWIANRAHEAVKGRAIGVHESLMGLGIALGPLLLRLCMDTTSPLSSWSYYWASASLILLVAGVLTYLMLNPVADVAHTSASSESSPHRSTYAVLLLVLMAASAALCSGFIEVSVVSFLPLYLTQQGLVSNSALLMLTVFGLGGTLLQFPLGYLSDRLGLLPMLRICCAIIIAASGYSLWMTARADSALVLVSSLSWSMMFLWGAAVGGLNTLAVIHAGTHSSRQDMGLAMAIVASAYTLGSVLGPFISGLIWQASRGTNLLILILSVASVYLLLLLTRRRD